MFGFGKKKELQNVEIEENINEYSESNYGEEIKESSLEEEIKDSSLEEENNEKVEEPLKESLLPSSNKDDILASISHLINLDTKMGINKKKRKNKYDREIDALRLELVALVELQESLSKKKNSNTVQNLILLFILGTIGGSSFLGYEELKKYQSESKEIKKELGILKESNTNFTSTVAPIDKKIVKEITTRIDNIEKINKNLITKVNSINKNKSIKILNLVEANMAGIKKLNNQFGNIKSIKEKTAKERTEYERILLEFNQVASLMSTLVTKQKEEIISLNKKVSIIQDEIETSPKGKITTMVSKDDKKKITMMETRLLKNNDMINGLSNSFKSFIEEYNSNKIQELEKTKVVVSNAEVKSVDLNKPPFVIYKIINNKTFYIKNRLTGKLLEQDITLGDIIIDRYEVLNIDKNEKIVIFKDIISKKSIVIEENK